MFKINIIFNATIRIVVQFVVNRCLSTTTPHHWRKFTLANSKKLLPHRHNSAQHFYFSWKVAYKIKCFTVHFQSNLQTNFFHALKKSVNSWPNRCSNAYMTTSHRYFSSDKDENSRAKKSLSWEWHLISLAGKELMVIAYEHDELLGNMLVEFIWNLPPIRQTKL